MFSPSPSWPGPGHRLTPRVSGRELHIWRPPYAYSNGIQQPPFCRPTGGREGFDSLGSSNQPPPVLRHLVRVTSLRDTLEDASCETGLPAWMSLQGNQMSCVQMICSLRQRGLSIPFAKPTRFSTAWISDNHGLELGISPKGGLEWTAGELNVILQNNLVPSHGCKGQLRTFCCIQWECERYSGRPRARCYPFNLAGHRFLGKNRQVHMVHVT